MNVVLNSRVDFTCILHDLPCILTKSTTCWIKRYLGVFLEKLFQEDDSFVYINERFKYFQERNVICCCMHTEKNIVRFTNMNLCYIKWVFFFEKIINSTVLYIIQEYLLIQHINCITDSVSCTVTESKIHVK